MQLVLNEENLRKGWGSASEYWFSPKNYEIKDVSDIEYNSDENEDSDNDSEYYRSIGLIPYFKVTDIEVMKAFVAQTRNSKIIAAFDAVSDKNYVETFWKYFNAYKEFSEKYDVFEHEYVRKKAADWCYDNSVNYTFEK